MPNAPLLSRDRTGLSYEEVLALSPGAQQNPTPSSPRNDKLAATAMPTSPMTPPLSPTTSPRSIMSTFSRRKSKSPRGRTSPRSLPSSPPRSPGSPKRFFAAAIRRCASPFGIIPAEDTKEKEADDNDGESERIPREMMVGGGPQWQQQQLQPEGDGERLTLTSSMPFRSLEEDPQWGLFLPFDSLEFSFVGGAIGVCRPVPDEFSKIYIPTLTMMKPTIQRVTGLGSIFLGTKKKEVMLWGPPLKPFTSSSISSSSVSSSSSSSSDPPADDLRLADQMLRLALVGDPQCYSFWYLQYFNSKDVGQLLGRREGGRERGKAGKYGGQTCGQSPARREGGTVDSSPAGEEEKIKMEVDSENAEGEEEEGMEEESEIENDIIISKIESMTGTRILVAPYEGGKGLRRCFLLMGEEELVAKARNHLQGAITQKISPTGREVMAMLAGQEGENGGWEVDERLEEIRKELRDKHRLRMMEVQRDGNCLFRALSVFEHKTETKHRAVRAAIVARLKEAPEAMEVTALVEGISSEEYLRRMAEDRQWGGYTECMAWSEARKKHVRLYVENEMIGLRCTDIECEGVGEEEGGGEKERVQLLLYKSHYWLCVKG